MAARGLGGLHADVALRVAGVLLTRAVGPILAPTKGQVQVAGGRLVMPGSAMCLKWEMYFRLVVIPDDRLKGVSLAIVRGSL